MTYQLMAYSLNLGVFPWIIAKFLLTCMPVLIFLVFHNY